jgi:hypothetical protein
MIELDRCFITGCDTQTQWQLPWFLDNYRKFNTTPIVFCDFGVDAAVLKWAEANFDEIIYNDQVQNPYRIHSGPRWWLKPAAIAAVEGERRVWLDTDCEVLGCLDELFPLLERDKINIVRDRPWSTRRQEHWFNTGVVGVVGFLPTILGDWVNQCRLESGGTTMGSIARGDQDALRDLLDNDPMKIWANINELPNKYNWLRIQLLDGQDSPDKLIMHWTGPKGNQTIWNKING